MHHPYQSLSVAEQGLIQAALEAVRGEARRLGIRLPDAPGATAAADGMAQWFLGATVPEEIKAERFCNWPTVG